MSLWQPRLQIRRTHQLPCLRMCRVACKHTLIVYAPCSPEDIGDYCMTDKSASSFQIQPCVLMTTSVRWVYKYFGPCRVDLNRLQIWLIAWRNIYVFTINPRTPAVSIPLPSCALNQRRYASCRLLLCYGIRFYVTVVSLRKHREQYYQATSHSSITQTCACGIGLPGAFRWQPIRSDRRRRRWKMLTLYILLRACIHACITYPSFFLLCIYICIYIQYQWSTPDLLPASGPKKHEGYA